MINNDRILSRWNTNHIKGFEATNIFSNNNSTDSEHNLVCADRPSCADSACVVQIAGAGSEIDCIDHAESACPAPHGEGLATLALLTGFVPSTN